ncbi:RNA-directed DNA polymerase, eukaryota, reverse transcriptase zinc-binding domain protein [Tanacetum coccineum]
MFLLPSIRITAGTEYWDFCRFIKVTNSETLINLLNNVWIGKLRLHANLARFNRKVDVKSSKVDRPKDDIACKASYPSLANSYENSDDFPLALLGCCKDFRSIANTHTMCSSEGFLGIDFKYLGGLWVLFDFNSKDVRDKFLNHNGTTSCWTPTFIRNDQNSDEASSIRVYEKHEDHLFDENDTKLAVELKDDIETGEEVHDQNMNDKVDVPTDVSDGMNNLPLNSDPFGLGPLINKKSFKGPKEYHSDTQKSPPGFSLINDDHQSCESINNLSGKDPPHPGFSLLGRLEETIKVGLALGLNMEGCEKTLVSLIADKGDFVILRQVWGNTHFDFASSSSHGMSGGSKMSKLDLFLVSDNFYEVFPHSTGIILEKDGFRDLVVNTWKNDGIVNANGMVLFKKKLQNLKNVIQEWVGLNKSVLYAQNKDHQAKLSSIDIKIDQGKATEEDFKERRDSLTFLGNFDRRETGDLAQKAKVEDPGLVKVEFLDHFRNRFEQHTGIPPSLDSDMLNPLSHCHQDFLERPFSRDEIRSVVWDCGGDRAPGPDGFTFKFFTSFWDIIEDDVARFVHDFFRSYHFPTGCNSSFIALILKVSNAKHVSDFRPISLIGCQYKIICKLLVNRLSTVIGNSISPVQSAFIKGRNILDGPLILNEVLDWYHQRKKELMIFKVNFEKAFDSLHWDFLYLILDKLVNGSPTEEFKLFRGLGQGDHMSSFLFILAMEGLHALTCKAKASDIFKGASAGRNNMYISHLMHADDVIFFGEWSWVNAHNLISMLRCFFLISGLKINIHKSNVLGIGVTDVEVSNMVNVIGCGAANFPLKYLGIPVGCNMSRCSNWNVIIQKFSSKLCSWKARLLSIGGRLSLIKSVPSNLPTYYMCIYLIPVSVRKKLESMRNRFFIGGDPDEKQMTWVKWDHCLASRKKGNLGIGSILGLNIRVFTVWKGASTLPTATRSAAPSLLCSRRLLASNKKEDTWCGEQPLKAMFLRIYLLDTDKSCSIASRVRLLDWSLVLRRNPRGGWTLDPSSGFSIASVRSLVDSHMLDTVNDSSRWNKNILIKVNVFLWRLKLNKLPSRVNLDRRGIKIESILCPSCHEDIETINHSFFNCGMAKDLWSLLTKWWELDIPVCSNIAEWFEWLDSLRVPSKVRLFLEGVAGTLMWSIWNYRNNFDLLSMPS